MFFTFSNHSLKTLKQEQKQGRKAEWKRCRKTKSQGELNCGRPPSGTAVPRGMVVPPGTASPCQLSGRLVVPGPWRTAVRSWCPSVLRPFSRIALFLMPQASSNLYFSSKSSQNAIFACETRRFSLKAQKSHNTVSYTHLTLPTKRIV